MLRHLFCTRANQMESETGTGTHQVKAPHIEHSRVSFRPANASIQLYWHWTPVRRETATFAKVK